MHALTLAQAITQLEQQMEMGWIDCNNHYGDDDEDWSAVVKVLEAAKQLQEVLKGAEESKLVEIEIGCPNCGQHLGDLTAYQQRQDQRTFEWGSVWCGGCGKYWTIEYTLKEI